MNRRALNETSRVVVPVLITVPQTHGGSLLLNDGDVLVNQENAALKQLGIRLNIRGYIETLFLPEACEVRRPKHHDALCSVDSDLPTGIEWIGSRGWDVITGCYIKHPLSPAALVRALLFSDDKNYEPDEYVSGYFASNSR